MVVVSAPAKLNLTLDVLGRRPDGYHDVATVMQTVDLADIVTITPNDSGHLSLTVRGARLPMNAQNTAWVAAQAFLRRTRASCAGFHIHLDKKIPMQAGMAGGSADAAGVLVGLNALTGAGLSTEELCEIGARVGADVPFCLAGGTALAAGIGTALTPCSPLPDCVIVVAKPSAGVSTAQAYAAIDGAPMLYRPDNDGMCRALAQQRLPRVGQLMCNVFEQALALPDVEAIQTEMRAFHPLGSCMTGSGSAVFALFASQEEASRCAQAMLQSSTASFVSLCHPCRVGAQVISNMEETV